MASTNRIDIGLLDDSLKNLINASAKIFPITYSLVQSNTNTGNFEYGRVIDDVNHKNEVYYWDVDKWVLIGAEDRNVDWSELRNVPNTFPPTSHNHDTVYSPLGHQHSEADITDLDKYSKTETDTLLGQKAALNHNHDTEYNTKEEIETFLSFKSDATHTHAELHTHANKGVIDQVTQTHVDALNNGLTTGHSHTNKSVLDKITYSGSAETIDLNNIGSGGGASLEVTPQVGVDLNNLTTTGRYSVDSTSTNTPNANPFIVEVLNDGSGIIMQIAYRENSTLSMYFRRFSTTWGSWAPVATANDLASYVAKSAPNYTLDLNTLTSASGFYNATTASTNTPVNGRAFHVIQTYYNSTTKSQIAVDVLNGDTYTRSYVTNAWGSWVKLNVDISGKADTSYVNTELAKKADSSTLSGHTSNSTVHVTQTDKDNWNGSKIMVDTVQPTTDIWYKVVG